MIRCVFFPAPAHAEFHNMIRGALTSSVGHGFLFLQYPDYVKFHNMIRAHSLSSVGYVFWSINFRAFLGHPPIFDFFFPDPFPYTIRRSSSAM